MDYNLWKSVLLDWVNSTGFLVQNYENLGDTNIETFFDAFKRQIKSTHIKSENVINFVRDYYKEFYIKLDENNSPPVGEYVYFYSLFLHFACVLHADMGIQQICNNMVRKNQELIEKFLDYMFKYGKCERGTVQSAIEEAENFDLQTTHQSPIARNIQTLLSNTSPQTPKSRMLNTWNLENRNLKAQLETERFERGYLEMQLNQCEKKLMKLDDDYKEAMAQNNYLKKQIQSLDEHDQLYQIAQSDVTVKQLRREIDEKESELFKLTVACNDAKDDIEILKEKLQYAETQIKSLNIKLLESFTEAETFKNHLDEREKMIGYMNSNNKELSDLLKELQSNSKKQDFDSSASYEMLNSTANDLNTSSSLIVSEENLASAVVDIRLIDQQKQNMALTESVNRLQAELNTLQEEASRLYKIMASSSDDDVEPSSTNALFSTISKRYKQLTEINETQSNEIKTQSFEIASLNEVVTKLECTVAKSNEEAFQQQKHIEQLTNEKSELQAKITALTESISEFEKSLADYEEKSIKLEELTSELNNLNENLKTTTDQLNESTKSFEVKQKENLVLNEKLVKLQTELSTIQEEATKLHQTIVNSTDSGIESSSPIELFVAINTQHTEMVEMNKQLSTQIESHCTEIASLKSEISQLNDSAAKSNEEAIEQQKRLEDLAKEKSTLEENVAEMKKVIDENEKTLADYEEKKAKIEEQTTEMASLSENLKNTNDQLYEMTQSLYAKEKENLEVNEKLTKLQRELSTIQEEAIKAHQTIVNSTDSVDESTSPIDVFVAINMQHTKTIELNHKLSHQIESHCAEITLLQQEINQLTGTVDKANEKAIEQQMRLEDLIKERSTLEENVAEMKKVIDENEKTLADYEMKKAKIEELSTELTILNEHVQATAARLEENKQEIEKEQQEKRVLNETVARLEKELTILQENASVLYKNIVNSEDVDAEPSAVFSAVCNKYNEITATNQQLSKEIEMKCDEITLLKNAMIELESKITKTAEDLLEKRNQYENLVNEKSMLEKKIDSLTQTISQLEKSLADYDEKKAQIDQLTEELTNLNENLKTKTDLLHEATQSLEAKQIANLALSETVSKLRTELTTIQEETTKLHQTIVKSSDVDVESLSPITLLIAINTQYTETIEINKQLSTQIESHCTEIASLKEEINQLTGTAAKSNEEAIEQQKRIEDLAKEKSTLEENVAGMKKVIDENEKMLADYEVKKAKIEELTTQLTNLNDNLKAVSGQLDETKQIIEVEHQEKRVLNETVACLENELSNLRSEIVNFHKTVTKADDVDSEPSSPLAVFSTICNKYNEITATNQRLSKEIETYCEDIISLKKAMNELESKITKSNEEALEQQKHIEQLTNEKSELQAKIAALTESISEYEKSLADYEEKSTKLEELTSELNNLNENLKTTTDQLNESTKSFEVKQKENLELNEKLTKLQTELSTIQEEATKLHQTIVNSTDSGIESSSPTELFVAINTQHKQLSTQIESHCTEIASLKSEISQLNDSAAKSNEEAIEQRKRLEDLAKEKSTLEENVAEMKKVIDENEKMLADYEVKTVQIEEQNKELIESCSKKDVENVEFKAKLEEINAQLSSAMKEKDLLREQLEKLEQNATEQRKSYDAVVEEKDDLATKVEQLTSNIEHLEETLARLRVENKALIESSTNKEQLLTLNEQLVRMEKTYNEKVDLWKKEKESLIQDVKICRAKLMKEREAAEQKEKEFKIMRNAYEEKFEKLKDKMKSLYKEEMAKVQDKHEAQLNELVNENRRQVEKLVFYDEKTKEFSSQIHALNEEKLMLLKEHEIMKSELRTYEIDSTLNRGNGTSSSAMFFDKFRGGNFRMEDEEGELFDNTYLDELKKGAGRDFGRESLTLDEIQRRNSMVPPHLRSSYMPQYASDETKAKENIKSLDDSMFSTVSEAGKRGTAYKRPGPPTPSKNGGRFSFGGGELPRGDILREHNGRPSVGVGGTIGGTSKTKKSTPGKFSRIFSTSKIKDEDKENVHLSSRNTLEQLQKLFFSTSTPRRRPTRHSSLPKFEFERANSFSLMNTSVSKIERKVTGNPTRLGSLIRRDCQTKRLSRKVLWSADTRSSNCESTPEYDKIHRDSTQLVTSRKSVTKKRTSILKKKAIRNRVQKDKRFAAYNQMRRMSKIERNTDATYSLASAANISAATYDVDVDVQSDDFTYEIDIQNFQAEVNQCQGPVEIVVDNYDDEIDFEKLCNVKESDCPFEDKEKIGNALSLYSSKEKCSPKSFGEGCSNVSPQSVNSNGSASSTTRMSSHCARLYWSQHKIPKIETYKAEKKSFENDSRHSSRSNHSNQSLFTTIKSMHSSVIVGWHDLPSFIQYYMVAITFCFISILYYQLTF